MYSGSKTSSTNAYCLDSIVGMVARLLELDELVEQLCPNVETKEASFTVPFLLGVSKV